MSRGKLFWEILGQRIWLWKTASEAGFLICVDEGTVLACVSHGKKNIIEGRFPNAKLGVSAHPTFWRTKESQEDLQKGQNVLREISVKENHGTWWWSLFCVLNVVLKMGLKSNFASDQSLSGNLEQKASKHRTRAVDQKNLMLKIYFALPQ